MKTCSATLGSTGRALALVFCILFMALPARAATIHPLAARTVMEAQQALTGDDAAGAISCLEKFLKKHPGRDHCLVEFTLGVALVHAERPAEAEPRFRTAVTLDESHLPSWQNLGSVSYGLGHFTDAAASFARAHALSGEPRDAFYTAAAWMAAGENTRARPLLESIIAAEDAETAWLEAYLKLCLDLGLHDKGRAACSRLLDREGDNPRWWQFLAWVELRQEHYGPACAALKARACLVPPTREDLELLGDVAWAADIPAEAARFYEQLLDDAPPERYARTGRAWMAAHDETRALAVLEKGMAKSPTAELALLRGQIFWQQQRFILARDAFRQAAGLDAGDGSAWFSAASCSLALEDWPAARTDLLHARDHAPQQEQADKLLLQLRPLLGAPREP